MTLAQALAAIDAQGYLVDIGQLARGVADALRRRVRRGELVAFDCFDFPIPKRGLYANLDAGKRRDKCNAR